MGIGLSIITAFVKAVKQEGGGDEDIYRLATPEGETAINQMAKLLVNGKQKIVKTAKSIAVDYSRKLSDMIADGKFDGGVNSDITEKNFPHTGSGVVELEPALLHFGQFISSENALEEMEAKGLRAANMAELVSYKKKNPDEQRKYPIVALGQVGHVWYVRSVGVLGLYDDGLCLGLSGLEDGWIDDYRFLAFPK